MLHFAILVASLCVRLLAFPPVEWMDHDNYKIRENSTKVTYRFWPKNDDYLLVLMQHDSVEVRQRAEKARLKGIDYFLESLGEPSWADWPNYHFASKGWCGTFYLVSDMIRSDRPRHVQDRYANDYASYRVLQYDRSRKDLLRGCPAWTVELEWFFSRMVENHYWSERGKPQPIDKWFLE